MFGCSPPFGTGGIQPFPDSFGQGSQKEKFVPNIPTSYFHDPFDTKMTFQSDKNNSSEFPGTSVSGSSMMPTSSCSYQSLSKNPFAAPL